MRTPPNEPSGLLNVTGRDVDEMVYKVNFINGQWSADGDDLAEAAQRAATHKFGAKMQQALELVNTGVATTCREVSEYLDIPEATARKYLSRLAGERGLIERTGVGTYGPVTVSQLSHGAKSGEMLAATVNRPGMSGDSASWEGWSHVRWFVEEVPAGAA